MAPTPRQKSPGTGGWFVAPDPTLPAAKATVLWHPEIVPTAVVLAPTPGSFAGAAPLSHALFQTAIAQYRQYDGLHILLPGDHLLWLPEQNPSQALSVVIPLDDNFLLRVAGALRLRRLLDGKQVGPPPRVLQLTLRHRKRLIQMLSALDGHLSAATYREIASCIFGATAANETGWKTLPVRAQTIRLVKDAAAMMNRGYLRLLRGRE